MFTSMFGNPETILNKTIADLMPREDTPSLTKTYRLLRDLLSMSDDSDKAQLIDTLAIIDEELASEIRRQASLNTVAQVKAVLQRRVDQLKPLDTIFETWKKYYANKNSGERKSTDDVREKMQKIADEIGEQIIKIKSEYNSHPFEGGEFKEINNKLNKELKATVEKIEHDYIQWCKSEDLRLNLVKHTMKRIPESKRNTKVPVTNPEPFAIDTSKMGQISSPKLGHEDSRDSISLDGPPAPELLPLDRSDSEDDKDREQPISSPPQRDRSDSTSSDDDEIEQRRRMVKRLDSSKSSVQWKGAVIGTAIGLSITFGLAALGLLGFIGLPIIIFSKLVAASLVFGTPICAAIGYKIECMVTERAYRKLASEAANTPRTHADATRGVLVRTKRPPSPPASPSYRDIAARSVGGHDSSEDARPSAVVEDRTTQAQITAGAAAADFESVVAVESVRSGQRQ